MIEMARKVSEEGTLFGSVSSADIAEAVTARGLTLEKSEIELAEGPLKTLGDHEIPVSVHPDVHLRIRVIVTAEE